MVSVIMPTYKQGQYLKQAILAVEAQNYKDTELIVVSVEDDETLTQWTSSPNMKYTWIKVNKPQMAEQFVVGLNQARGNWVLLAGSDDFFLPNKIDLELTQATRAGADLCYSGFFITDNHFNIVGEIHPQTTNYNELKSHNNTITDCSLIKTESLKKIGVNTKYGNKFIYAVWLNILKDYKATFIDKPTMLYRDNPFGFRHRAGQEEQQELVHKIRLEN